MPESDTPAPEPARYEVGAPNEAIELVIHNSGSASQMLATIQAALAKPAWTEIAEQATAISDKFRDAILGMPKWELPDWHLEPVSTFAYAPLPMEDWRDRRIDELSAKVDRLQDEVRELRRPIAETHLATGRMAKHFDPDPD